MEFGTYTNNGLAKKLHEELKKDVIDTDLITRINSELKSRSHSNITQMSPDEQIFWILKDMKFERIQKAMEAVGWTWGGDRTPTIIELVHEAENRLREIANEEENDYHTYLSASGGFEAERNIFDGVMSLSLRFVISSWEMDYDSVTCDNYSEKSYTPNWDINDIANDVINNGGDYD